MKSNSASKKSFILFTLIFIAFAQLFAEDTPQNTSERIKTKSGYVYQQTLNWQEVNNASKYVLVIQKPLTNNVDSQKVKKAALYSTQVLLEQEKKENTQHIDVSEEEEKEIEEGFEKVLIYGTKKTSVNLMLPYGSYRYKVVTYIKDRAFKAPWHELEIRPALKPVITDIEPKRCFLDKDNLPGLKVYGINLLSDSEFYIAGKKIKNVQFLDLETYETNNSETEKDSLIFFPDLDLDDIDEKSFLLIVKNKGNYAYKYEIKKTFFYENDFLIGIGYHPSYILDSSKYSDDLNNRFIWGAPSIEMTWITNKISPVFYFGFSFQSDIGFFSQKLDDYTLKFNTFNIKADLHNQLNFNKNLSISADLGIDFFAPFGYYHVYEDTILNDTKEIYEFDTAIGLNAQLRLYYNFDNGLYLMAMADVSKYAYDYMKTNIRGGIFAGYRFNMTKNKM